MKARLLSRSSQFRRAKQPAKAEEQDESKESPASSHGSRSPGSASTTPSPTIRQRGQRSGLRNNVQEVNDVGSAWGSAADSQPGGSSRQTLVSEMLKKQPVVRAPMQMSPAARKNQLEGTSAPQWFVDACAPGGMLRRMVEEVVADQCADGGAILEAVQTMVGGQVGGGGGRRGGTPPPVSVSVKSPPRSKQRPEEEEEQQQQQPPQQQQQREEQQQEPRRSPRSRIGTPRSDAGGDSDVDVLSPRSANTVEGRTRALMKSKRHGNILGESVNIDRNYKRRVVQKTAAARQLIGRVIREHFLFSGLDETVVEEVIDAMAPVRLPAGHEIITQGSQGDNFYVIEGGTFDVFVSGTKVASIKAMDAFGELALLYNCPRAATVTSSSKAVLWALDRDSFRHTLAVASSGNLDQIRTALKRVPLLEPLSNEQVTRVADAVQTLAFQAGDYIIRKGEEGEVFYMIRSGTVVCTDIGAGGLEDLALSEGDFFGERALLKGEPRAANVVARTDVTVMALDRQAFTELLGPLREVLDSQMGMRVMKAVPMLRGLSEHERQRAVESLELEEFAVGAYVVTQGQAGDKFYIVKEGSVVATQLNDDGDPEEIAMLNAGDYFGEVALLGDEPATTSIIAETRVECFTLRRDEFHAILEEEELVDVVAADQAADDIDTSDITLESLDLVTTLGTGTFGRVFLARHRPSGRVFALKTMLKSRVVALKQKTHVLNEKAILMDVKFPFILKLYRTFNDRDRIYMLMEMVQGGELLGRLWNGDKRVCLRPAAARFYSACVLLSFQFLHQRHICYRDLKPENVLIDEEGFAKLVDFGFAKVVSERTYTLCGTPEYLAPEIVLGRGYSRAVDYWALGVLIYEMVLGRTPFAHDGDDQMSICRNIVKKSQVPFHPKFRDDNCKDLIRKLLQHNPGQRLGTLKGEAEDIKKHPWFANFDFRALLVRSTTPPWVPPIEHDEDTTHFDDYDDADADDELAAERYEDDGTGWDEAF